MEKRALVVIVIVLFMVAMPMVDTLTMAGNHHRVKTGYGKRSVTVSSSQGANRPIQYTKL